ncbi:hypothetical protein EHR10_09785 [Leptospira yasudae]|nr:hypothetical protein EHR10_09785 [Leptospira yasudae]
MEEQKRQKNRKNEKETYRIFSLINTEVFALTIRKNPSYTGICPGFRLEFSHKALRQHKKV